jgi:hypothetical protein
MCDYYFFIISSLTGIPYISFSLEQIDLEQSPSFTHIWTVEQYLWKGSRPAGRGNKLFGTDTHLFEENICNPL